MAKKNEDLIKTTHEPHKLPCKLDAEAKAEVANRLADAIHEAESLELEKKSVNAGFKSRLDTIKERIHNLSSQIKEGVEMRSVDCELLLNYSKLTATLFRLDTFMPEEVEVRPLTDEEKQAKFEYKT